MTHAVSPKDHAEEHADKMLRCHLPHYMAVELDVPCSAEHLNGEPDCDTCPIEEEEEEEKREHAQWKKLSISKENHRHAHHQYSQAHRRFHHQERPPLRPLNNEKPVKEFGDLGTPVRPRAFMRTFVNSSISSGSPHQHRRHRVGFSLNNSPSLKSNVSAESPNMVNIGGSMSNINLMSPNFNTNSWNMMSTSPNVANNGVNMMSMSPNVTNNGMNMMSMSPNVTNNMSMNSPMMSNTNIVNCGLGMNNNMAMNSSMTTANMISNSLSMTNNMTMNNITMSSNNMATNSNMSNNGNMSSNVSNIMSNNMAMSFANRASANSTPHPWATTSIGDQSMASSLGSSWSSSMETGFSIWPQQEIQPFSNSPPRYVPSTPVQTRPSHYQLIEESPAFPSLPFPDTHFTPLSVLNSPSHQPYHLQKGSQRIPSGIIREKMVYVERFGEFGCMPGQFTEPSGVAVRPNNDIAIADTNNHRIQVFDRHGRFKFQFGQYGRWEGQLMYPNRVSTDFQNGSFVISERAPTHQLQIYDSCGQFVRRFGADILCHPRGLCVDRCSRIVVVECKVMRVVIFDQFGNVICILNCMGHLNFPNNVCVNSDFEIFISDNGDHCVKVINYAGHYLRKIGGQGLTNYPIGVSINRFGQVVIIDNHNDFNATIFAQDGTLVAGFESKVKHAHCLDACLLSDGSVVMCSKDFRVYVYRYLPKSNTNVNTTNNNFVNNGFNCYHEVINSMESMDGGLSCSFEDGLSDEAASAWARFLECGRGCQENKIK